VATAFSKGLGSIVVLILAFTCSVQAEDWRPINPTDLASKTAIVEKDADAEALFWEVRLDDGEVENTILRHYLRVKIFSARGVEALDRYTSLEFQRDIPVRSVKYYIKPFVNSAFPFPMLFTTFHMPNLPLEKEKNGFLSFTLNCGV